jgi:1-deoxy-D-xylulose-5-phosphate reductoisomerase
LPVERLDLGKLGQLTFRPACETRWPALRLAREVMQAGGLMGAVFNAAKEEALTAFIARQITFPRMAGVVEDVLTRLSSHAGHNVDAITLDMVAEVDHLARVAARTVITGQA